MQKTVFETSLLPSKDSYRESKRDGEFDLGNGNSNLGSHSNLI